MSYLFNFRFLKLKSKYYKITKKIFLKIKLKKILANIQQYIFKCFKIKNKNFFNIKSLYIINFG